MGETSFYVSEEFEIEFHVEFLVGHRTELVLDGFKEHFHALFSFIDSEGFFIAGSTFRNGKDN